MYLYPSWSGSSYLLDKTSIEDGYLVSKLPRVCCSWVYILLFEL